MSPSPAPASTSLPRLAAAPSATSIALRPYQLEAIAAVRAALDRGIQRQLLVLPTGAGKTLIFGSIVAERDGRALILAHRDELLRQAVDKLQLIGIPSSELGLVQAEHSELGRRVVVASVQTLAQPRRLAQLAQLSFETIVVDEAHHVVAPTYRQILAELGAIRSELRPASRPAPHTPQLHLVDPEQRRPDRQLLLGVTATPDRGDRVGLGAVFDQVVYKRHLLDLIRDGYLVDLRALRITLEGADLSRLHVRAGDVVPGEVERIFEEIGAPEQIARAYSAHGEQRRGLVFVPSVAIAHETAAALRARGVPAEAIDGQIDLHDRHAILERFSSGQTQVLTNCQLLGEGFDEPRIETVIIARPTRSRALYAQFLGRGTRPYPSKRDLLVLDLVGASERHDLLHAASLLGLEPRDLARRSVVEIMRERLDGDLPRAQLVDGQLVATPVELFRQHHLAWLEVGSGEFLLSLGSRRGELLIQRTDGDRWRVVRLWPDRRAQLLAKDLDLGYAQGVGEAEARRLGADALIERVAPWRDEPASEAQLRTLEQLGVAICGDLTKGQASEQIGLAIARSRRAGR